MTIVWLNGVLLDAAAARIDPRGPRFLRSATAIFETIRAIGGIPAHAARHFARLRDGAAVLGITGPIRRRHAIRRPLRGAARKCATRRGAAA
ncbi:MAG: hypothetical protein WDN04_00020 [Rhodospirillales bacterium]